MNRIRLFETFLFEYKMSLDEIKDKYYKDISSDDYLQIIQADPTTKMKNDEIKKVGKYTKWILQLYKGKKYKEDGKKKTYKLKLEDLYKVKEYLKLFDKFKRIIKKEGNDVNIFDYNTLPQLYDIVKKFEDSEDEEDYFSNKKLEKKIKKEETDKVFENDNWLVVIPKTHRAACYYGKNTQWCTASKDDDSVFNEYNKQGNLYINTNKKTNEKYQFHFETNQFMDERDEPIMLFEIIKSDDELYNFYEDKFKNTNIKKENGDWYFYANNGWEYFISYFKIPNKYRDDVIKLILNGEGRELFDYDLYSFNLDDYCYLNISDKNIKYIKNIIQKMKDDENIKQEDIDNIKDFDDIIEVIEEYVLDGLKQGLINIVCHATGYADESNAYNSIVGDIMEHFGFEKAVDWVKRHKNDEYDTTLRIKFKSEMDAKKTTIMLFQINDPDYDNDDLFLSYDPPYNGYSGDVNEYINDVITDGLEQYIDEKYLP